MNVIVFTMKWKKLYLQKKGKKRNLMENLLNGKSINLFLETFHYKTNLILRA